MTWMQMPPRAWKALTFLAVVASLAISYGAIVYLLAGTWVTETPEGSVILFGGGFLVASFVGLPIHAAMERRIGRTRGPSAAEAQHVLRVLVGELAGSMDLQRLVGDALEAVTAALDLERASVFLAHEGQPDLVLVGAQGAAPAVERLPLDHALVRTLGTLHLELAWRTAAKQPRYARVRSECLEMLHALGADLVLPIELERSLVGVLALGPGKARGALEGEELDLLRDLAAEIGLGVARARDVEHLQRSRLALERFARFLPESIANDVLAGRLPGEGGRRREVTLVACELRRFMSGNESREPEQVVRVIEAYRAFAAQETAAEGGTLAQVRGGSILAVFGDPDPVQDHALRGVRMARRLAAHTRRLASALKVASPRLEVGVGLATGAAFVGFVQFRQVIEYQVIGEVAARARALADRATGGAVLATAEVISAAGSSADAAPLDTGCYAILLPDGRALP